MKRVNRAAVAGLGIAAGGLAYLFVTHNRRSCPFPRDSYLDSTASFLKEGYQFISRRCDRLHSDAFESRLMLHQVICVRGEEAARMFCEPGRFTRRRGMPVSAFMLLQEFRSVQTLDGSAHRHRKQLFLSALTQPERVLRLVEIASSEWAARLRAWQNAPAVVLHDEACDVLCRAACAWADVPLHATEARQRARDFTAMIEGSGEIGPRNWRAQVRRRQTERWIEGVIQDIRWGRVPVMRDSAAYAIAWHRDRNDEVLNPKTAAVELINVLRPTETARATGSMPSAASVAD
jgi:fatty-acid peroxygenase